MELGHEPPQIPRGLTNLITFTDVLFCYKVELGHGTPQFPRGLGNLTYRCCFFIYVHTIMHYVHICEMLHGTSGIVVYHLLQIRMKYILIIVVCLGFRLAAFVWMTYFLIFQTFWGQPCTSIFGLFSCLLVEGGFQMGWVRLWWSVRTNVYHIGLTYLLELMRWMSECVSAGNNRQVF